MPPSKSASARTAPDLPTLIAATAILLGVFALYFLRRSLARALATNTFIPRWNSRPKEWLFSAVQRRDGRTVVSEICLMKFDPI